MKKWELATPPSGLKESEGQSPAQLSPPCGPATCFFHNATGIIYRFSYSSCSAAPPDSSLWDHYDFSQFIAFGVDFRRKISVRIGAPAAALLTGLQ